MLAARRADGSRFGALGCAAALQTGSGEAVQGLFPLFFVFIFLSSSNLPRNLLKTGWFHTVATWNPISYLIEGFRSLYIYGWDGTALWRGFAVGAGTHGPRAAGSRGRAAREAAANMSVVPRRLDLAGRRSDRVAQPAHLRARTGPVRALAGLPARVPGELRRRPLGARSVPASTFPAGYTAFQFVFVLCQSAMFAGLFTGFSLAFDFESGFARQADAGGRGSSRHRARLRARRAQQGGDHAHAGHRRGAGGRGCGSPADGVDVFGLYVLAALLVLVGYGWAAGVAFRFRSIQAGPLMQTPVFLLLFLAPVYVPISLLKGWIHAVAKLNPATAFLQARPGPDLRRARPHRPRVRGGGRPDRAVRRVDAHRPAPRRGRGLKGPAPAPDAPRPRPRPTLGVRARRSASAPGARARRSAPAPAPAG